jgi:hypothetical protein
MRVAHAVCRKLHAPFRPVGGGGGGFLFWKGLDTVSTGSVAPLATVGSKLGALWRATGQDRLTRPQCGHGHGARPDGSRGMSPVRRTPLRPPLHCRLPSPSAAGVRAQVGSSRTAAYRRHPRFSLLRLDLCEPLASEFLQPLQSHSAEGCALSAAPAAHAGVKGG